MYMLLFVLSVGLFEPGEKALKLAFTSAIERMNLDNAIGSKRMVVYYTEDLQPNDSFEANKQGKAEHGFVCYLRSLQ